MAETSAGFGSDGCDGWSLLGAVVPSCIIAAVGEGWLHWAVDRAIQGRPFPLHCYAVPLRTGGPDGLPVRGGRLVRGAAFGGQADAGSSCLEDPDEVDVFVGDLLPPEEPELVVEDDELGIAAAYVVI